jgi:hypothetical protein
MHASIADSMPGCELVGFPAHARVVHVVVQHYNDTTTPLRNLLPQNTLGLLQGHDTGIVPDVKGITVVVTACFSKKASLHGVKLDIPHLVVETRLIFLP